MNCQNCKHWKRNPFDIDKSEDRYFGKCNSPKWNVHPNYYTESENKTEIDGVETTYIATTGERFGCVHFEER